MTLLDQLLDLTRFSGQPQHNYVIIGEGNTSCRIDDDSFYVKASGQQMSSISHAGFVAVNFEPILALLDNPPTSRAEEQRLMEAARVDTTSALKPSVEVTFHALLLRECKVGWIVHTHPVAVNRILCSNRAEQFARNRMFPDEAVLCDAESVFVPYADPGLPLALAIRTQTRAYMDKWGQAPKVILLANHGLIALGQTPTETLNITAMCVKAAEIFAGACAVGEPVFMSQADVLHICRRPDEIYRRNLFTLTTQKD